MPRRRLIKGRGNNLPLHRPLHVGHLFRPFIDQQHDQITFRVVLFDRVGDVLQQHRLTRPRRCHDQRPLPFADWRHQIDDPGRPVLDRRVVHFHGQPFIRIKRCQVLKRHLVARLFRILKVDPLNRSQREITLIVIGLFHDTFNGIAGAQRILADHVR